MTAPAAALLAERTSDRLGSGDWLDAARNALISGGIAAVKVEPLAASLSVTIGSFYWHYKNRAQLHSALLEHWRSANSAAMIEAATREEASVEERFDAFINIWVTEDRYSPAYDSAMRDWARTSDEVRRAVHEVDTFRVSLLKAIFEDLGYDPDRAEVRARITYFHQVGFYALDLRDDEDTRLRLRPLYFEALREGPGRAARALTQEKTTTGSA
ncbi:MAG TPA: TetR/AcrR family transcriptional regulator [Sphingomicrobium sp.]|nr:TetR/AcrR family transcriptional regulator [Sphingomicrobium sp.]